MRRVSIIRVMLVVLVIGLALGAIGYQKININLLALKFQRGTEALLGLRLGLDLQGGSHLVYQARGAKEISLAFRDPDSPAPPALDPASARASAVNNALIALGTLGATVESPAAQEVVIKIASLREAEKDAEGKVVKPAESDAIRQGLAARFGPIGTFVEGAAEGGGVQIAITFQSTILTPAPQSREEVVRQVLRDFGKTSAQIRPGDGTAFTILLDTLAPEERDTDNNVTRIAEADALKKALEERVGAIASFTVTDLPANASPEQMEGVLITIEKRVNPFGISEPVIQLMDENRVLVQLPGIHDVEEVKRLIGRTARLEFKERECVEKTPITISGTTFYPCELPDNRIDRDTGLTGEDLERAYPGTDPQLGRPIVNVQFNSRGAKIFAELTTRLFATNNTTSPDRFVVFLDEEEVIAPVVRQPILSGTAFIEGPDFTTERVRTISIQLESGRLPVPLELVQEQDVDATLGKDSLRKSLIAGAVGLGLTMLFMVLYYKASGVVATLALLIYTAMVLAIFKLIPVTLTLAGIAGFILSIGMAVDANVLIFERMKEELRVGRTLASAIEIGFSRAWTAIWDSNLTTIITSVILIWFGQRTGATLLAGFGTTLAIGVVLSMFSSVFISKLLLTLFAASPLGFWRSLYTPEPLPSAGRPETAAAPAQERK
ncbi:MAG: protein translocase subunit SecD [Chloroflexi bacterium]|nr:protein translocase subunit SecD [Chloroflexota bacterium]